VFPLFTGPNRWAKELNLVQVVPRSAQGNHAKRSLAHSKMLAALALMLFGTESATAHLALTEPSKPLKKPPRSASKRALVLLELDLFWKEGSIEWLELC
jgi:hypothetical protein